MAFLSIEKRHVASFHKFRILMMTRSIAFDVWS
jgi:hypothetical protein